MKLIKYIVVSAMCTMYVFLTFSCTGCTNPLSGISTEKNTVSIVSYNAQTFFDAVEDGSEFKEFKGSKTKWSKAAYTERLLRLKEAVMLACLRLGGKEGSVPDVLVLQEIESKAVIEDFCKLLPYKDSYPYAVFIPHKKGSAFSTALLSKLPVSEINVHDVYSEGVELRPLVETRLKLKTSEKESELVLFNVHWKSKVGKGENDKIRLLQEKQAYSRLVHLQQTEPDTPFVLCGDFNQPLTEFTLLQEFPNCWNFEDYQAAVSHGIQKEGSYFFNDIWEGIDHFFYSDNLKDGKDVDLVFFCVMDSPPLVDKNGIPAKYSVFSGKGYSDHLPIGCVLRLR